MAQKGFANATVIISVVIVAVIVGGIYWWQNMEPKSGNIIQEGVGDYQRFDEALKSQY